MINPMMIGKSTRFAPISRYYNATTMTYQTANGTTVAYLSRRFIPSPEQYDLLTEHIVEDGERPDTIAAQYMGDSELFWRICDANNVIDPNELADTSGRTIRITLPQGIPGPKNA